MLRVALCVAFLTGGMWLGPSLLETLVPAMPTPLPVAFRHPAAPPHRAAAVKTPGLRLDPRFTAPTLTAGTASDTVTARLPRGATYAPAVAAEIASLEAPPADTADVPPVAPPRALLTEDPLNLPPLPRAAVSSSPQADQPALPIPLPRPASPAGANRDRDQAQPTGRRGLARLARTPGVLADPRSLFDRVFGTAQPPNTVLAYAAPEDGSPGLVTGARRAALDSRTAVYDIAAHTVTLPDGTRLEAHSGLGARLDDPRGVTEHMRGATPPNVYELTPREAPFHGVAALRLTPVGGTTYGRGGLLAHTYMLGPRGDSNGCVVFRDYKTFRRAFDTGMIRRLVVVARVG